MGQDLLTGAPTIALNQQNAEVAHNEAIYRASAVASRTVSAVNVTRVMAFHATNGTFLYPTAPTVIILSNVFSYTDTSVSPNVTYDYPNYITYLPIQVASPKISDLLFIAPGVGWIFVNTADNKEYRFDGTLWKALTRTIVII